MNKYYFTTDTAIFGDFIICTNGEQYRVVPSLFNGRDCLSGADLFAVKAYVKDRAYGWDTDPDCEAEYKKLINAYNSSADLYDWGDVITDIARDYPNQIHELDFDPMKLENVIVLRVMN